VQSVQCVPPVSAATGVPSVSAVTGVPSVSAVTGVPSVSAVTGVPPVSAVTGVPSVSAVTGVWARSCARTRVGFLYPTMLFQSGEHERIPHRGSNWEFLVLNVVISYCYLP